MIKLLPFYLLILLGWVGGRKLELLPEQLARVLIYILTPIVFFGSISQLTFEPTLFLLLCIPFLTAWITMCIIRILSQRVLPEEESRVVSAASGMSNGGYFGIPLCVLLLGEHALGIWMLLAVGATLFEFTGAYYQLARSRFSVKESVRQLMMLPVLWATALGLLWSYGGFPLPAIFLESHSEFRGAYFVLGMMLIGVSLSRVRLGGIPWRAVSAGLFGRMCAHSVVLGVVTLSTANLFPETVTQALLLFALLPVAANLIVYSTHLELKTQAAAPIVFLSTVMCSITVPLLFHVLVKILP